MSCLICITKDCENNKCTAILPGLSVEETTEFNLIGKLKVHEASKKQMARYEYLLNKTMDNFYVTPPSKSQED